MADVNTQQGLAWGPSFPARTDTGAADSATVAWPLRRGSTDYGGTVSWNGSPAERRVVLLDLQSMSVLAATASSPSGAWSLPGWSGAYQHIALCVDSAGAFQAIAFDRV